MDKITRMDTRNNSTSLTYRRATEKQPSLIELVDPTATGEPLTFKAISEIGKGAYGNVRKFGHNNTIFVVKKPHEPISVCTSTDDISKTIRDLDRELDYLKIAYPGGPYGLIKFVDNENELDYRQIMPFINGAIISDVGKEMADPRELAHLILNTCIELQRLHNLGLVHGDVSPSNILVDPKTLAIRLIDFSFTREPGKKIRTFELADPSKTYMPPERIYPQPCKAHGSDAICATCRPKTCRAHVAQDIYTLSWTIDFMIKRRKTLHPGFTNLNKEFPCITSFIEQGLKTNPDERPSLQSLINQLQPLLVIQQLKHQLLTNETTDSYQILTQQQDKTSVDQLLRLSHEIILSDRYDLLLKILVFIESQEPDEKSLAIVDLYRYISAQKTASDNTGTQSPSLFFWEKNFRNTLDKLNNALSLAKAINFADYPLNANTLNDIKSTPMLLEIYNRLLATGAKINIAPTKTSTPHI